MSVLDRAIVKAFERRSQSNQAESAKVESLPPARKSESISGSNSSLVPERQSEPDPDRGVTQQPVSSSSRPVDSIPPQTSPPEISAKLEAPAVESELDTFEQFEHAEVNASVNSSVNTELDSRESKSDFASEGHEFATEFHRELGPESHTDITQRLTPVPFNANPVDEIQSPREIDQVNPTINSVLASPPEVHVDRGAERFDAGGMSEHSSIHDEMPGRVEATDFESPVPSDLSEDSISSESGSESIHVQSNTSVYPDAYTVAVEQPVQYPMPPVPQSVGMEFPTYIDRPIHGLNPDVSDDPISPSMPSILKAPQSLELPQQTWNWPPICEQLDQYTGDGFRELAKHLQYAAEHGNKVLAFASAQKAAGRTSVLLTLTRILALEGLSKVLLVDADFRHPHIATLANLTPPIGLEKILDGTGNIQDAAISMTPGRVTLLPMIEPVSVNDWKSKSTNLRTLLMRARKDFDLILLDVGVFGPETQLNDCWLRGSVDAVVTVARQLNAQRAEHTVLNWKQIGIESLGVIETFA